MSLSTVFCQIGILDDELEKNSVCGIFAHTANEG